MDTARPVLLPLLLLAAAGCGRDTRTEGPAASPAAQETAPARLGFAPEEVFRRAFWRHPGRDDVILRAERDEPSGPGGAWRWALAVRPSPELVSALRAPDAFGLRPAPPAATPPRAPDWFPAPAPGDEVLAVPGANLFVFLRSADGVLYASDHGAGLAPPAR